MKLAPAILAMGFLAFSGCKREVPRERGDAPPPQPSTVDGLCAGGGGKIVDAIAAKLLPATAEGYCIDPHNEVRTYGKDGKGTIEQVCTELFDGECEVYRSYALERVVSARYADGSGTPGNVTVNLSRFDSIQNAFGFFTKRVVGDADPTTLPAEPFEAGTVAALGSGVAYLVRGVYVAELSYSNDNEDPKALLVSAKRILPTLGKAIGELLPGEKELPTAARLLPVDGRVKLGLIYEPKDVFGVTGAGPGAIGYYRDGEQRYRLVALERANDQAAQDVMKTVRRATGASEQKNPKGINTLEFRLEADGMKIEWVLARAGRAVLAIGDDEHGVADASKKTARLPTAEKTARLLSMLAEVSKRLPNRESPSESPANR